MCKLLTNKSKNSISGHTYSDLFMAFELIINIMMLEKIEISGSQNPRVILFGDFLK